MNVETVLARSEAFEVNVDHALVSFVLAHHYGAFDAGAAIGAHLANRVVSLLCHIFKFFN